MDNHEVRLYCHSEQRAQKEAAINQQLCQRFEEPRCKKWRMA